MWAGNTPYAVLTYVPGDELKDLLEVGITPERGAAILEEIFCAILVPVWQAGLRFKDFHPGNFIVQQDGTVVMIDTEQIRKDAKEMLATPNDWTQRNRHADQGLRRIPKLIERVVLASGSPTAAGKMNQNIRSKMDELHLYDRLNALGKGAVGENAQTLCEDIRKIIRNFF